jgi:hypothetical protein
LTVETRYFRSDTQTVNGLTAYKLLPTNTTTAKTAATTRMLRLLAEATCKATLKAIIYSSNLKVQPFGYASNLEATVAKRQ